jgi:DNA invertase Pin-like site-specific DNA recombinase
MEAQRAAIAAYAQQTGSLVVATYNEVETGRRPTLENRPELVRALAHARRSGALLVIARLDRLARNVFITAQLLESGVDFVATDNPHANRFTIHILAAMAEHESRLISERIRAAFQAARARGVVFKAGVFPPGAAEKGTACATVAIRQRTIATYADIIPTIVTMRRSGMSCREVAAALNKMGHRNQRHNPWTGGNVHTLLKREGYPELAKLRARLNRPIEGLEPVFATRTRSKEAYREMMPAVRSLYDRGYTTRHIADYLNERGHRTVRWGLWTTQGVLGLLRLFQIPITPRDARKVAEIRKLAIRKSLASRRRRTTSAYAKARPLAARLRKRGWTYQEIARELSERGLDCPRGGIWNAGMAWRMLNRDTE